MLCGMGLKISDIDIYGKRLGLFYKNKEKISNYIGIIFTVFYIGISLGIFIYYTIQTIKHVDLAVNDSTIYSKDIPHINLNNSELLYFAFAVEIPSKASRFIDETIYTVKAIFYDSVKNQNGEFEPVELRNLKVEKCNQKKFGLNYQHLFTEGEFNNSYCLSELDFVLTGGFIYDKLSLIRLDIYPCVNSTENNFHCKPQEIIDNFLAGGYFSILLKDVGLNPGNYSYPILPTLQDMYTTISKDFFRDLILYYEITEVKTDSGVFFENYHRETFLKFDKKFETFFLRSDENYYNGESICGVQIRLSDNIHLQNRQYKKIHNVFATAGGYMQMLNTIFSILSIFPNKFFYDNIIIDNLFDFDVKKNKIISKVSRKNNAFKKKRFMSELINLPKVQTNNRINLNILNKYENANNESKSEKYSRKLSKNDKNGDEKSINISAYEKMNNASKIDVVPFSTDLHLVNNTKLVYIKKTKNKKFVIKKNINAFEDNNYIHFNLNILDYLCLGRCKQQNKNYQLFRKGTLIFKEKLDVIYLFNYILFSEKKNEEEIIKNELG